MATMAKGCEGWEDNETLRRAVNIDRGVVVKPGILARQSRQAAYPLAAIAGVAA